MRTVSQVIQELERKIVDAERAQWSVSMSAHLGREILDHLKAHERIVQELIETRDAELETSGTACNEMYWFCRHLLEPPS